MIEIKPDASVCNNELPITTVGGGIQLPSKFCTLPKDHPGEHTDGRAWWKNVHRHMQDLAGRQ